MPADIIETFKGSTSACTVSFGNRKSNIYLRFYDKKMERLCKLKKDSSEFKEVMSIPHWVRCEFEFRNNHANKLVIALLKLSPAQFSEYLSEVMNKYIRFTDTEFGKSTRRTICAWWSDFLGTVKRSTLRSDPIQKNPFLSACNYVRISLAPTLDALRQRLGNNSFLSLIKDSANPDYRFKQKHYDIISCSVDASSELISDVEFWERLIPYAVKERVSCATA